MKSLLAIVMAGFIISGCASLPESSASAVVKEGAAVVYGQGGGVAGFVQGVLPALGKVKDVKLSLIDGERAISIEGRREYWIKPGKYRLKVYCEIRFEIWTWYGNEEIEANLEAGKEYLLDGGVRTRRGSFGSAEKVCEPSIKEKHT